MPEIRRAAEEDIEAIFAVDSGSAHPIRERFIREAVEKYNTYIAVVDGQVAGYAVLKKMHFFGYDFISLILVKETQRRNGLASLLMQRLEREASGQKLFSSTNESNKIMQGIFDRRGFVKSGVIENLDPGDPEWVYVKFM